MLSCPTTLSLVVQGAKFGSMCQAPWGHDVSLAQVTGVHSIINCMVLGGYCGGSTVVARAVGVLSGTSRPKS